MRDPDGQSEATYTAVWVRWACRRLRELTPTHGRRGALAALLREARGVTSTARLIRWEIRESVGPRRDRAKAA